jgi:hypothetical protein
MISPDCKSVASRGRVLIGIVDKVPSWLGVSCLVVLDDVIAESLCLLFSPTCSRPVFHVEPPLIGCT